MQWLIAAAAVGLIGLMLWITGTALKRKGDHFRKNVCYGKAEITGHYGCPDEKGYDLMVRMQGINGGKPFHCRGPKITPSRYPVGQLVDIAYVCRKSVGISLIEAYLKNANLPYSRKTAKAICRISYILLIAALVMAAVGLYKII